MRKNKNTFVARRLSNAGNHAVTEDCMNIANIFQGNPFPFKQLHSAHSESFCLLQLETLTTELAAERSLCEKLELEKQNFERQSKELKGKVGFFLPAYPPSFDGCFLWLTLFIWILMQFVDTHFFAKPA